MQKNVCMWIFYPQDVQAIQYTSFTRTGACLKVAIQFRWDGTIRRYTYTSVTHACYLLIFRQVFIQEKKKYHQTLGVFWHQMIGGNHNNHPYSSMWELFVGLRSVKSLAYIHISRSGDVVCKYKPQPICDLSHLCTRCYY